MLVRASLVPIAFAAVVGCGGSESPASTTSGSGGAEPSTTASNGGSGSGGAAGGGGAAPIVWGACPTSFESECATVALPLDWSDPSGKTVEVFVARLRSGQANAPALWLLQGGPGGSADVFASLYPELTARLPNFDFYALEHRGVGHSSRLGCDKYESDASDEGAFITPAEWPGCLAELEKEHGTTLADFTTTNAAHDLAALVERTRAPKQDVFVYGVSYGTYWAQRYLELFPTQPTGVVLDSIVSPGVEFISDFDKQYEPVGDAFLADCAADAGCSARMTDDPKAFVASVFDAVDQGHCPELGLDRDLLRQMMSSLITAWFERPFALGLIYRIQRCDPADVTAIVQLYNTLIAPSQGASFGGTLDSDALFYNIALSELWPAASASPAVAEEQAVVDASFFAPGSGPEAATLYPLWPLYPHDRFVGKFATTGVPMLMLGGTLDAETPIALSSVAKQHYASAHQTFVTIPNAAHATIEESPDADPTKADCGMQVMVSFLNAPTEAPDVSCLATLLPISFDGYPDSNTMVWGTSSMWDNAMSAQPPSPNDAAAVHALQRRRHARLAP